MFAEAGESHRRPHFHAYYQEWAAVFIADEIELMAGSLPKRQERLVLAWAEIHQDELLAAWESLQAGQPPERIEPLE
jgi:hypothetical protein